MHVDKHIVGAVHIFMLACCVFTSLSCQESPSQKADLRAKSLAPKQADDARKTGAARYAPDPSVKKELPEDVSAQEVVTPKATPDVEPGTEDELVEHEGDEKVVTPKAKKDEPDDIEHDTDKKLKCPDCQMYIYE